MDYIATAGEHPRPEISVESRAAAAAYDARYRITAKRLAAWAAQHDYHTREQRLLTCADPAVRLAGEPRVVRVVRLLPLYLAALLALYRMRVTSRRLGRSCRRFTHRPDAYEIDSWLVWRARGIECGTLRS